ncbi:MAG: hypothetical protein PVI07_02355 [Anaerolineae bacterium]
MAKSPSISPSSTFVVRLWHEWTAEGPRWRGRIEHLQSGEGRAFLDADALLSFVGRFADLQDEAGERAGEDG